ncbi:MAG: peptidoglycan editing factor PgeF [Raineya sp.]|nr:peptidoglycan editing factor PgeF [Raineya sp.]
MILQFQKIAQFHNIKHFVSTRQGGISNAPFDSLNLGFGTADLPENVVQNRKILAETTQMPLENWCVPRQTHSDNILCISPLERGKGAFSRNNALPDTDGLLTKHKHIALVVQSADCVCSLYYDMEKNVIGAAHAGWRGTLKLLPQKMIQTMQKEFDSKPENIWVGIAPCISVEMYEVGEDVVSQVDKVFGTREKFLEWNKNSGKYHFNLRYAHLFQLQEAGVLMENIEVMPKCTYTEKDLFFSARRDKDQTGRFGAGIMMIY